MKRRAFLKSGSALALPIMVNGMPVGILPATGLFHFLNEETDKILVLVQLNGGNDGLNTIIPTEHYDQLAAVRSNILIPEQSILPIGEAVGMHPAMAPLHNLYQEGLLSIVRAVGYPNQNRSHFRSTDIWVSGSASDTFLSTGWMGRYFDSLHPGYPENYPNSNHPDPIAITMGSVVSETCQGLASNFSMALVDPFGLGQLPTGESGTLPDTNYGHELAFLMQSIVQANAYSGTVSQAAENGTNLSALYAPGSRLAQQLKNVALLISGGLKTKLYVVSIGGFDTHANQVEAGDPLTGIHSGLLAELSTAIAAFQDDLELQGLDQRVLGMTFSEFGRQIRSNNSLGTDHGTAAPLFLFGSCVEAGLVGSNPEIGSDVQPQEGVAMQYDFRSVYGTILQDWLGASEDLIEDLLFPDYQHLPLVAGCGPVTSAGQIPDHGSIQLEVFPNPARDHVSVRFETPGGKYRLSLFNHLGHEVRVITEQKFPSGRHECTVPLSSLPQGNYYIRIQGKDWQEVRKLIRM